MTSDQITLVQESFALIIPVADDAAAMFYGRLFQLDPSLRSMFKGDMKEQGKKLMLTLRAVVSNLRDLDHIIAGVQALARRHSAYGVRPEHYATVGHALIDTLRKGLGVAFTKEVFEAWAVAYTLISEAMIEAVEEEELEAV